MLKSEKYFMMKKWPDYWMECEPSVRGFDALHDAKPAHRKDAKNPKKLKAFLANATELLAGR